MKKLIITQTIALLLTITSFAQEVKTEEKAERKLPTVEEIAKHKADRMRQQYLLGEDQYNKVYKLCLKQAKQDEARRKEIKAEREALEKDLKEIFNDAQWERFEKNKKHPTMRRPMMNRRGQMMHGQGRHPMAHPHANFMKMGKMPRRDMGHGMPQMAMDHKRPMPQMKGQGQPNPNMPQMGNNPKSGKFERFDRKPMGAPAPVKQIEGDKKEAKTNAQNKVEEKKEA